MQFGPSSRTEFMELGGEDEIEKMREGTYLVDRIYHSLNTLANKVYYWLFVTGFYDLQCMQVK